jgi:hypothetical protein
MFSVHVALPKGSACVYWLTVSIPASSRDGFDERPLQATVPLARNMRPRS